MKKLNIASRFFALLHAMILLGSLLLPFGSFYGRKYGNEGIEIARIFSLTILLFIPALAGYFIAKKIKNFYLYIIIGLGMSIGVNKLAQIYIRRFETPQSGESTYIPGICFMLSMFIIAVYVKSYVKRTEDEWGENIRPGQTMDGELAIGIDEGKNLLNWPDIRHTLLLVLHYAAAVYLNLEIYVKWIFILFVCDIIIIFLNKSFRCLQDFFFRYRRTGSMPMKAITRTILGYMLIGIFFMSIALVPSLMLGHEPLLGYEKVSQQDYAAGPINASVSKQKPEKHLEQDDGEMKALEEEFKIPEWFVKVMRAMIFIIILLSALVIGGAIWGYIRESSKAFRIRGAQEDEIEYLEGGLLDKKTLTRVFGMAREELFHPSAQIRSLYKKLIKRKTKGTPVAANTPYQLLEEADALVMPGAAEIQSLYEKARYSQYEMTAEESRLMKKSVSEK